MLETGFLNASRCVNCHFVETLGKLCIPFKWGPRAKWRWGGCKPNGEHGLWPVP